jgi:hypothetical protein
MTQQNATIRRILEEEQLTVIGDVIVADGEASDSFAYIKLTRDYKGHRTPKQRQINNAKERLKAAGLFVTLIYIEPEKQNIEEDLRLTLLQEGGELVRNVFFKSKSRGAEIWIMPKTRNALNAKEKIYKLIERTMSRHGVRGWIIKYASEENVPTKTAILSVIRKNSPLGVETLFSDLTKIGFDVPNEAFLMRMLDNLRKSNLVIRRGDGLYVLSLLALRHMGTSKNSRSPDVSRLLDLARKGG